MSLRHTLKSSFRKLQRSYLTLNQVEVSRAALLNNFDVYQSLNPDQQVIPVLKSNAYGHGLEQVAEALKGRKFPYIAVDGHFEALQIREVSNQPILVMGAIHPDNFANIDCQCYTFVVHETETVRAIGTTGKKVKVHIELETGMNRHGVKLHDLAELLHELSHFPNLTVEGVMSHLADADGQIAAYTEKQVALFDRGVEQIQAAGHQPVLIHIGQSTGSLVARSKYANTFRLGLGLYGFSPFEPSDPRNSALARLTPALRVVSTVTKVLTLEPGESVSYGCTFTADRLSRIGVIPIGYYEGLPRALSNKGCVLSTHGEVLSITGRICMNHCMLDLTDSTVQAGEKVVVISNEPRDPNSVTRIAAEHGLFTYLLLVSINENLKRVLVA